MDYKKLFFYLAIFIIGCILLYYGFSVSQSGFDKVNNVPWSWIMLVGVLLMIFSGYKIIKY